MNRAETPLWLGRVAARALPDRAPAAPGTSKIDATGASRFMTSSLRNVDLDTDMDRDIDMGTARCRNRSVVQPGDLEKGSYHLCFPLLG